MLVRDESPVTKLQVAIIVVVLLINSFLFSAEAAGAGTIGASNTRTHASLRAMARIHMASGSYDKAEPFLKSAVDLAKSTNAPDADVCACTLDLAYLRKNQGRLAEAENLCISGLKLQEDVYGPDHPHVAMTLRILAEIYRRQGRFREAMVCMERAMTIMLAVESDDDPAVAPFKVDMARLLVAKGNLEEAESYFDQALTVIESRYGLEHLYTARVLTSMATLYVLQGRYDDADKFLGRALPVQEKMYGANHHFLVPAWLAKSRIHQARGDTDRARALLVKSLRVAEARSDSGRVLRVLETQVQLARETGDGKLLARLQRRIDKIRGGGQYAYAPVARAIQ